MEVEGVPSRLHTGHRAQPGTWSHDSKIMTGAETNSQLLNRMNHPGTLFFKFRPILVGSLELAQASTLLQHTCSMLNQMPGKSRAHLLGSHSQRNNYVVTNEFITGFIGIKRGSTHYYQSCTIL